MILLLKLTRDSKYELACAHFFTSLCHQGCQLNEYQADYKSPPPVRPPRPPVSKHVTSSEPTAAVDGDDHYMNTETAEKVF